MNGVKRKAMIMKKISDRMLDFIDVSPTCFHVVENLKKELIKNGYEELDEKNGSLRRVSILLQEMILPLFLLEFLRRTSRVFI